MFSTSDIDRLSRLVSTIGSRDFSTSFYKVFREMFGIEKCTVFAFRAAAQPQSLIVEGSCATTRKLARKLADDYISGGYLTDPNVRLHSEAKKATDIYVMNADDINDASYREHYYELPAISQELVIKGNVGPTFYYMSLYGKNKSSYFGNSEVAEIKPIANYILKTLHRHSELVSSPSDLFPSRPMSLETPEELRQKTLDHLCEVLLADENRLSLREAQVCAAIALGYTTEGISIKYSISTNTVATHRKRAYTKLGITSQNELFVLYFSTVRNFQTARAF